MVSRGLSVKETKRSVFVSWSLQGFHLVLLKVMLFRERLILSLGQNNLSHFFTDMDPFGGQYIKVGVTKFLYFLFMCLKNRPKSKNLKYT